VRRLASIADLKGFNRNLLKEVSLSSRIESLLEDMNIEDIRKTVSFDIGSGGRRSKIFHASTLGDQSGKSLCGQYPMGCAFKLYGDYLGLPQEGAWQPRNRRILDTGSAIHAQIQGYLSLCAERSGGTETFLPETNMSPENSEVASDMEISGHTDGIYCINREDLEIRVGVEIKTINDNGFKSTGSPHGEHAVQATVYQKCLDLPVMVFLYYNKNDSSIQECFQVYDPLRWEAIEKKIDYVRVCTVTGEEPKKEVSFNCGTCKYKPVCKPPRAIRGVGATHEPRLRR
jgi:hypothetical protein